MRRIGKLFGVGLLGIIVTGMTLWGMGALSYAPLPTPLREGLVAVSGLATAGAFLGLAHRRRTLLGFVLVWAVSALSEGLEIRPVVRVFAVAPNTVLWQDSVCIAGVVGDGCQRMRQRREVL